MMVGPGDGGGEGGPAVEVGGEGVGEAEAVLGEGAQAPVDVAGCGGGLGAGELDLVHNLVGERLRPTRLLSSPGQRWRWWVFSAVHQPRRAVKLVSGLSSPQ